MSWSDDEKARYAEDHRNGWSVHTGRLGDLLGVAGMSGTMTSSGRPSQTRPDVVCSTSSCGPEQRAPSALADEVPFTRQAVMKHLAVLEDAGLVTRSRQGREVRFAVHPRRLNDATRAMTHVAEEWDRRLRSIKRIAEAAHRRLRGQKR